MRFVRKYDSACFGSCQNSYEHLAVVKERRKLVNHFSKDQELRQMLPKEGKQPLQRRSLPNGKGKEREKENQKRHEKRGVRKWK
jgi:hypothetical protein